MARRSRETLLLVYIITYSRADTVKFPTTESFGEAISEAWKLFVEIIFCTGSCALRPMQIQTVIAMSRLTSIIFIWL